MDRSRTGRPARRNDREDCGSGWYWYSRVPGTGGEVVMKKLLSLSFICFLVVAAGLLSASPAFADYTVTGKFQYEDRVFDIDGFTGTITPRPIRFADVRIMITGTSSVLASGPTNSNGDF